MLKSLTGFAVTFYPGFQIFVNIPYLKRVSIFKKLRKEKTILFYLIGYCAEGKTNANPNINSSFKKLQKFNVEFIDCLIRFPGYGWLLMFQHPFCGQLKAQSV